MAFAHPFWLFLLILVPFIGAGAALIAHVRGRRWQAFVAGRLRPSLLQRTSPVAHWVSFICLLAALAVLVFTLARPQGDAGTQSEVVRGRNILYALDLSRSMRVDDVKPDRLSQSKAIIYEMMDAMPNDRVGLVGFAGKPYLFAPLTIDHSAVRETVEQLDETWVPTGGSDIVGALKLSIETLKKTGIRNNALVLISDGEKHDGQFDDIVREAKEAGVFIFTIGVGTEEGGFVPHPSIPDEKLRDRQGNVVLSRLHPDVLKKIASETKGRYVLAGSGVDIPALANAAMADLDQFEVQGRERRVVVEFYQWLLGPAIVSLLISILAATRWRPIASRTVVAATLAGTVGSASAASLEDAKDASATGQHEKARLEFHELADHSKKQEVASRYRLGEADAAMKGKSFRKASDAYSQALLSDDPSVRRAAHLGNGSSLFQLGWQSLADDQSYPDPAPTDLQDFDTIVKAKLKEWMENEIPEAGETAGFILFDSVLTNWTDSLRHFDSALVLNPNDADARQNRELVNRYLDRLQELLKEQSEEAKESLPQEEGEGPPQQGEGSEKGKEGQPGEGEEGQPGKGENGEKKDQDGSGGDQNKDSKQGNGGDKENKSKGPKEKPGETPKERAQRILGENEDMQKGPMTPGQREFARPEKDW